MNRKVKIGKIIKNIAISCWVVLFLCVFWLFCFERYNSETKEYSDGFGRKLYHSAGFYGQDLSPGLIWEITDTLIIIFIFGGISYLYNYGKGMMRRTDEFEKNEEIAGHILEEMNLPFEKKNKEDT